MPEVGNVLKTQHVPTTFGGRQFLLLLIPVLAAWGPLLPRFGPVSSFRAGVALYLLIAVLSPAVSRPVRVIRLWRILSIVWVVTIIGWMTLAATVPEAATEVVSVVLGLVFALTAATREDPRTAVTALSAGWILAFLTTVPPAVREVVSGQHMSNYLGDPTVRTDLIASTMGNPNNYGLFLVVSVAALLFGYENNWWGHKLYPLLSVGALGLIFLAGSRLSLLAAAAIVALWALRGQGSTRRFLVMGGCVVIALVAFSGTTLAAYLPQKIQNLTLGGTLSELGDSGSSGGTRLNLIRAGLWMVDNTAGLGVGPGGFEHAVSRGVPFELGLARNPHSGLVEIASQYGVLVGITFAVWVLIMLLDSVKPVLSGSSQIHERLAASLALAMVPGLFINSTYLDDSAVWTALALWLATVTVGAARHVEGEPAS